MGNASESVRGIDAAFPIDAPENPDFGTGVTRRRIRLDHQNGRVIGTLCDPFHEMVCVLEHDTRTIKAISGAMPRNPTTVCPGAIAGLQRLVGAPLTATPSDLGGATAIRQECTHLFDLAILTISHARRTPGVREMSVAVPDETDKPVDVEIWVDDVLVHHWQISGMCIVAPTFLAGLPLANGFHRWASEIFDGDAFEAAVLLQRTLIVAHGRRYRLDKAHDKTLADNAQRLGSCYAYQPVRAMDARFRSDHYRENPF